MNSVTYRSVSVAGTNIRYREAGTHNDETILLLHGFPTAGHMFRDLIPKLQERYHLIAPDFPGFGRSDMPDRATFNYTFENISNVMVAFVNALKLDRFALYIFDYGAPIGLRIALQRPDRITAIVSQNGNAYEDGLSAGWDPVRAYWKDPTQANRDGLRAFLTPETTYWQYTHGAPDLSLVSPDGYGLDDFYLARPGVADVQLDLLGDYKSNVALYPAFQQYFRDHQPPLLAVWGKNDPFFLPAGATAFKRDLPSARIQLIDAGHFALETHCPEIAQAILGFPRSEATANIS